MPYDTFLRKTCSFTPAFWHLESSWALGWMQVKNAEHDNLPQLNLRREARFVFISVEREQCGCSCCNMEMLPFHWPLYRTSSHDQNQSKLCTDRICCFSWEPLACCQHCSRGGGGCRAVQLIYPSRAIFSVGKNNFFWYIFSPFNRYAWFILS